MGLWAGKSVRETVSPPMGDIGLDGPSQDEDLLLSVGAPHTDMLPRPGIVAGDIRRESLRATLPVHTGFRPVRQFDSVSELPKNLARIVGCSAGRCNPSPEARMKFTEPQPDRHFTQPERGRRGRPVDNNNRGESFPSVSGSHLVRSAAVIRRLVNAVSRVDICNLPSRRPAPYSSVAVATPTILAGILPQSMWFGAGLLRRQPDEEEAVLWKQSEYFAIDFHLVRHQIRTQR